MAANREKLKREKDLSDLARRYLKGETQSEIALSLGVNQSTVSRDIRTIQRRWLAASVTDFDAKRAEQLAKIDELERTYWEAWQHSLNREILTSERKEGTGPGTKSSIRRESRDGNPAFLEGVRWCIERRCRLLGLDAPTKVGVGGLDGGPIRHEHVDVDHELRRLMAGVEPEAEGLGLGQSYELPAGWGSPN